MNNATLALIGRVLFGAPLIVFGSFHFMNAEQMAGMVPLPGGAFWVYLTGAALILAGISLLIAKMIRLASILLALMLLIFVFAIHIPGLAEGGGQQVMTNLLKDVSLMGGALLAGAYFGGGGSQGSSN